MRWYHNKYVIRMNTEWPFLSYITCAPFPYPWEVRAPHPWDSDVFIETRHDDHSILQRSVKGFSHCTLLLSVYSSCSVLLTGHPADWGWVKMLQNPPGYLKSHCWFIFWVIYCFEGNFKWFLIVYKYCTDHHLALRDGWKCPLLPPPPPPHTQTTPCSFPTLWSQQRVLAENPGETSWQFIKHSL